MTGSTVLTTTGDGISIITYLENMIRVQDRRSTVG